MINPNLASVNLFLQRSDVIDVKEKMQIRSTELQAVMSSAGSLIQSGRLEEIKFQFDSRILRKLSPQEKIRIYIILRLLSLEEVSENWFSLALIDMQEFYTKIGLKQSTRYFYLTALSDNQFAYEYDCILYSKQARTNFFRELFNPIKDSEEKIIFKNSFECLSYLIKHFKIHFIFKGRPKKKAYRKGYNDHGSLGSEFTSTLRQQSTDWSLNEREREQEKEKSDLLDFLLGFAGWI